jgi:SAM-dependent methyltransferase
MAKALAPPAANASSDQDRVNRRIYHARNIASWYRSDSLDVPETLALLTYQPAFAGRRVLDLGVGSGRTIRYLAPLASRYVCVDWSPHMVDYVRQHVPGIAIHQADMRDLSAFGDESFDFVFASCNLVDAVPHDDRLRVLGEVRRVLGPGGTFVFSSHNRRLHDALSGPTLRFSRNPSTQLMHAWRYVRSLVNHARVKRLRRIEADYAILNDPGHNYAALHYYIDRLTQQRQLEQHGFRLLDVFDGSGRRLSAADDDRGSPSLLYVAVRES